MSKNPCKSSRVCIEAGDNGFVKSYPYTSSDILAVGRVTEGKKVTI